jgi:hypothetical protein
LEQIVELGLKAKMMIENFEHFSMVRVERRFNTQKYLALQRSLTEIDSASQQLKKAAASAPAEIDSVDSLEKVIEYTEKESMRLANQIEKEMSRKKLKNENAYTSIIAQAEAFLCRDLEEAKLHIDEENLLQTEIDAACCKITSANEGLKVKIT